MFSGATNKRLEAENRLAWTAFYLDALQRDGRVQKERGDGMSARTFWIIWGIVACALIVERLIGG